MSAETHILKVWPEYFEATLTGAKTYEIRNTDDRNFRVGDYLLLREWIPERGTVVGTQLVKLDGGTYTGRALLALVTYMTPGGEWSLPANTCVMAIKVMIQPPHL